MKVCNLLIVTVCEVMISEVMVHAVVVMVTSVLFHYWPLLPESLHLSCELIVKSPAIPTAPALEWLSGYFGAAVVPSALRFIKLLKHYKPWLIIHKFKAKWRRRK